MVADGLEQTPLYPFENPNYFTNMVEMIAQVLIPIALIFAMGHYLNRRKISLCDFGVMTFGFLDAVSSCYYGGNERNPAIVELA